MQRTRPDRTTAIIVLFYLLLGCTPRVGDFYYISLENVAGIEIVRKGKVKIEGLFRNSEIPLEYKLQRPDYIVSFDVPSRHQPTLIIRVRSQTGIQLRIGSIENSTRPNPISDKGGWCGTLYIPFNSSIANSNADFTWSKTCISSKIKKELAFNVLSDVGSVIGTEIIPIKVVKNGFLGYFDAV